MYIAIRQGRLIGTRIIGDPEGLRALAELLVSVAATFEADRAEFEKELDLGETFELDTKITVELGPEREVDVICRVDQPEAEDADED